jgi:hypothetical protein
MRASRVIACMHPLFFTRLDADGQPVGEPAAVLARQAAAVAVVADELLVLGGEARGELVGEPCSADLGDAQVGATGRLDGRLGFRGTLGIEGGERCCMRAGMQADRRLFVF